MFLFIDLASSPFSVFSPGRNPAGMQYTIKKWETTTKNSRPTITQKMMEIPEIRNQEDL
jgi:hypothetical protein